MTCSSFNNTCVTVYGDVSSSSYNNTCVTVCGDVPSSSSNNTCVTVYVTGFVKIDPNHTGTEIHFIAEH